MENISEHVKREREARGITLEELAKGTFISVAVLKDIESGAFDKYKGDELYLKMYLRKIAKYLGMEEKELDAEFEALTQEIQLDKNYQGNNDKKSIDENKKNVTISEKVSDTFKDLKNVKPKKTISNKKVYEDRYLMRYFKYALVALVCVGIVFVVWYSIVATRTPSSNEDFKDNNTPTVEGNNDAQDQNTDNGNNEADTTEENNKKDETKPTPTVEITKNGNLDYSFKLAPEQTTFKFKAEFVGRSWCQLRVNGTEYSGFKSGIYNDANKSNSLDATPEVVELEFNAADFQDLELVIGYFMGHRFYINDTLLEIDPSEYNGRRQTLKITQVK